MTVDDEQLDEDEDDDELEEKSAPADRAEKGPFDSSEANPARRYVDLGGIRIPAREGLGLRLEVEESTKRLVAVALEFEGSLLQVQAFAAPRSEGLWHPIRRQLAEQITKQGGTATEVKAKIGPVLETKLPVVARGGQGGQTRSARFIGVDGPRWFLRGVLTGPALSDPAATARLERLFRSIVVVRGDGPIPPRELLKLVVPKAMSSQVNAADATPAAKAAAEPSERTTGRRRRSRRDADA
nr:DUF3710 domain-containing protein [Pseudoclavibacter chungangensis]